VAKQAMRPTMQPARMPCTAAKLRPVPSARAASPLFLILGHMHGGSQASGVLSDESRCREGLHPAAQLSMSCLLVHECT